MRPLGKLAVVALAAGGAFLLLFYPLWYGGGGAFSPPLWISAIAVSGVLCLLVASGAVLGSYKDPIQPVPGPTPAKAGSISSKAGTAEASGAFLAIAALIIPFPVGCNVSPGCMMNPEGAWSTIWPNVLTLGLGFVLFAWGLGAGRSRKMVLPGLGVGLILSGLAPLMLSLLVSYSTMCPAGGCPRLTVSGWWSLFWPDVVAGSVGILLVTFGSLLVLLRWPETGDDAHSSDKSINRKSGAAHKGDRYWRLLSA